MARVISEHYVNRGSPNVHGGAPQA